MSEKIRVLVVDDSALMRKLIPQTLLNDPKIEVVGTAMDGLIGLRKIEELRPHVVTLDLEMPRMDGIEMLRLGPLSSNRLRTGAQNQGRRGIRRSENDHHASHRASERPPCGLHAAALAVARGGDRHFHRRSERAAISLFPASRGFPGMPSCGPAHARRLYRNVCPALERILGP